jgi:hypothetical protein
MVNISVVDTVLNEVKASTKPRPRVSALPDTLITRTFERNLTEFINSCDKLDDVIAPAQYEGASHLLAFYMIVFNIL